MRDEYMLDMLGVKLMIKFRVDRFVYSLILFLHYLIF